MTSRDWLLLPGYVFLVGCAFWAWVALTVRVCAWEARRLPQCRSPRPAPVRREDEGYTPERSR
jgi:hypothetical protein